MDDPMCCLGLCGQSSAVLGAQKPYGELFAASTHLGPLRLVPCAETYRRTGSWQEAPKGTVQFGPVFQKFHSAKSSFPFTLLCVCVLGVGVESGGHSKMDRMSRCIISSQNKLTETHTFKQFWKRMCYWTANPSHQRWNIEHHLYLLWLCS